MAGGKVYIRFCLTVVLSAAAGCSLIRSGSDAGADAVARGARIAAVQTARAGSLIGKGTYQGSRRAVTWTGDRTVDGTQATLSFLGLGERPVPPDVLDRLPDQMLDTLLSLQFVPVQGTAERMVISSADSRWEGELFYRAGEDRWLEVRMDGPAELIVVSLVCFPAGQDTQTDKASYSVLVREDEKSLGEVRFDTLPNPLNGVYGQDSVRVSYPGVFIVKTLPGEHSYKFAMRCENLAGPALAAFFLPRYEREAPAAPKAPGNQAGQ